jgi:EmrB/QacA subfamily drug resistance transporter
MTDLRTTPATETKTGSRRGLLLATILAGQFMAILDVTIVNVAVPAIRTDLGSSGAGLQLVVAGYTITYAVLLVTGARLGEVFGQSRMFLAGLGVFTVASLLSGLAPTTGLLIAFRCLQGVGSALMVPQIMSLIQRTYPGEERPRALNLYAAVISAGAVIGQVLGGLLVAADLFDLSWRTVFLLNVPIGLALLALGPRLLPKPGPRAARSLDLPGLLTLSPAVLLLVLPLVLGHEQGWPSWTWLSLAASAVMAVVFVLVERRVAAPLVPAGVLRARGLVPAIGALLVLMVIYSGFLFTTAVHLQGGLGYSALVAGLFFAPGALAFGVLSVQWRRLPARWHGPMIPVGLVLAGVGYAWTAATYVGGRDAGVQTVLASIVLGAGFGLSFSPLMARAFVNVPLPEAADASGVMSTTLQLGQVLGVATFGTLFLSVLAGGTSADAVTTTLFAMAVAAVVSAAFALRVVVAQRPGRAA